jgi:hypothetical protein
MGNTKVGLKSKRPAERMGGHCGQPAGNQELQIGLNAPISVQVSLESKDDRAATFPDQFSLWQLHETLDRRGFFSALPGSMEVTIGIELQDGASRSPLIRAVTEPVAYHQCPVGL